MQNYDELFSTQEDFDKEQYKARKQAQRSEVYGMIDAAAQEMQYNGELFQSFLDVQARFDRYTVNNAILIAKQNPAATRLADFDTWQKEEVRVRKGEKGIAILEPGGEYTREDGSTATRFQVKYVFDISQTDSPQRVTPSVTRDLRLLLKALITHAPCQMQISDNMAENRNALYSPKERTIYVRQGMDGPDIFRALTSELAHARMSQGDPEYKRTGNLYTAHYVSYLLCRRYGVPADQFKFDKVPEEYAKMDSQTFRRELNRIRDVAGEISQSMNRVLDGQSRVKPQRDGNAAR